VKAKAKGKELAAPEEEGAPIINLMDALKASLGEAGEGKPTRKMAASRKQRAVKKARRKRRNQAQRASWCLYAALRNWTASRGSVPSIFLTKNGAMPNSS
jgi:hypothetical protein